MVIWLLVLQMVQMPAIETTQYNVFTTVGWTNLCHNTQNSIDTGHINLWLAGTFQLFTNSLNT